MEKGGFFEVASKNEQKMNRVYSCTHIQTRTSFYLLARTAFRPGAFASVLLKPETAMWFRDNVLGERGSAHASTDLGQQLRNFCIEQHLI